MPIQERLNRQAKVYIASLRNTINVLWRQCCEADGINPESKFVVFSDGNKYVPFYNKTMTEYMEAVAQYEAGGYVGLRIKGGKATSVE